MIIINFYLKNDIIESKMIKYHDNISSIDDARMIVINNLDKFYDSIIYSVSLINDNDNNFSIINVSFENDVSLQRAVNLNKILNE